MYNIFDCHPDGTARKSWLIILQKKATCSTSSTELAFLSQGDYDVVINDYEKAKSLFGNTEVPVFKKGKSYTFFSIK